MERKKNLLFRVERRIEKAIYPIQKEFLYQTFKPQRILFDHLPKCGGSTINKFLLSQYPQRYTFDSGRNPYNLVKEFRSLSQNLRYRYKLIIGHNAYQLVDFVHPDTIIFTIFREPVDRIISHYYFVKQNKSHYLHDLVVEGHMDLEDYAISGIGGSELRNYYATHFSNFTIEDVRADPKKVLESVEKNPEDSINCALQNILTKFDIIGFQDDLPSAVNNLGKAAKLYKPFNNEVTNKTKKRIAYQDVPESIRKIIANVNFLDVELYAKLKESIFL